MYQDDAAERIETLMKIEGVREKIYFDLKSIKQETPLTYCINEKKYEAIKVVLEAGAEPVVKHLGQSLILDETIQELYKTAKSKRYSESLRLF